jgi:NAD(P)H-flavin reductase/ferredoxin
MALVEYEGRSFTIAPGETVLDGLLRQGIQAAHACKAGSCGSCMLRAGAGTVPARAQSGFKESWKAQGYFLPCVCVPETDMVVTQTGADVCLGASITNLELLSPDVMQAKLKCDSEIAFYAGQYVTILREGPLARSYSIASLPEESEIELHIRKVAGGRMSGWFHREAAVGDRVSVLGPSGECFYVPGREEQPILLVGTGTGLAPLYGILRDALRQGHRGPIHLFHGALHEGGLYLVEELRRLATRHSHVEYTPTVLNRSESNRSESNEVAVGALDHVILNRFPKLSGWRAYVCGDPGIVQTLRKKLFLSGMSMREIYADAFLPAVCS